MLVCPTPFHAPFTVIRVQIAKLSCKLFPVDCHFALFRCLSDRRFSSVTSASIVVGIQAVKGKSKAARRTLDLTSESRSILARRSRNPSVWVFPSDRKSGAHVGRLNGAHDTVCAGTKKQRPLHFVLYDWRHTFATEMAQAGVDLATLAAIVCHSSILVVRK